MVKLVKSFNLRMQDSHITRYPYSTIIFPNKECPILNITSISNALRY